LTIEVTLPRKILIAIDGSDPSLKAVSYAVQIGKLTNASLTGLHVVLLPSYATPETLESLRKDLTSKGKSILAEARKLAESRGARILEKLVETRRSVVLAITEEAERDNADLIVLGTKGTSGIPKLMLGSVAAGVVSFAHCSVIGVR